MGLDECFFFNSLVVRLSYSLIFCQFWLFFVFKFVVVLLLVVGGGTVCLPTPPSWLEVREALLLSRRFTDEDSRAQKGEIASPGHTGRK